MEVCPFSFTFCRSVPYVDFSHPTFASHARYIELHTIWLVIVKGGANFVPDQCQVTWTNSNVGRHLLICGAHGDFWLALVWLIVRNCPELISFLSLSYYFGQLNCMSMRVPKANTAIFNCFKFLVKIHLLV